VCVPKHVCCGVYVGQVVYFGQDGCNYLLVGLANGTNVELEE
jgi:hypothetical protein